MWLLKPIQNEKQAFWAMRLSSLPLVVWAINGVQQNLREIASSIFVFQSEFFSLSYTLMTLGEIVFYCIALLPCILLWRGKSSWFWLTVISSILVSFFYLMILYIVGLFTLIGVSEEPESVNFLIVIPAIIATVLFLALLLAFIVAGFRGKIWLYKN